MVCLVLSNRFDQIVVRSPLGSITLSAPDHHPILQTVNRPKWQKQRIDALKRQGVDVRLGQRLRSIDGRLAQTSKETLRFGALVEQAVQ